MLNVRDIKDLEEALDALDASVDSAATVSGKRELVKNAADKIRKILKRHTGLERVRGQYVQIGGNIDVTTKDKGVIIDQRI